MLLLQLSRLGQWIILILLIGVLLGCQARPPGDFDISSSAMFKTIYVGRALLKVEVVSSPEARQQGLSGRESLAINNGMLFLFSEPARYQFWMKDMKFALDFLWVKNGTVVEISSNVPPPTPQNSQPIRVIPVQPVDAVIEVPTGWVAQNNIVVGDKIKGLSGQ